LIERAEKNEKKLALDNQILSEMAKNAGWFVIYLFEVDGNYTKVFFKMKSQSTNH
jgi:hypothetical protein